MNTNVNNDTVFKFSPIDNGFLRKTSCGEPSIQFKKNKQEQYKNPYLKKKLISEKENCDGNQVINTKKYYFYEFGDLNSKNSNYFDNSDDSEVRLFGGVPYLKGNNKNDEAGEVAEGGEAKVFRAKNPDNKDILRRIFQVKNFNGSPKDYIIERAKKQIQMLKLFKENNIISYELAIDSKVSIVKKEKGNNGYRVQVKQYIKRVTPIIRNDQCVINKDAQLYDDFIKGFPKLYNDVFKVSNIFKHPHGDIDKQNIGYEYVGENKDKTLVLKIYDNDQMVDGLSVFQDSLHKVSSIPLNEEILKYDSEHTHLVANDLYALLLCFVSVVNEDIHNRIPMSDEEYIKYSNMENELKKQEINLKNIKSRLKDINGLNLKKANSINSVNSTISVNNNHENNKITQEIKQQEVETEQILNKLKEQKNIYRKQYPLMGKKPGRYLTSIEKFKCVEETLNKFIADEKCQSKFTEFMNKMMVDNGSGIYFTKDDLPPQNLEFIAV